jgi:isopentenyl-diphosphate delta-isomerase
MRDGLQAAKALAMGASRVGLARPFLEKALDGTDSVIALMDQLEYELKISLFCLGVKDISEFRQRKVWLWERE